MSRSSLLSATLAALLIALSGCDDGNGSGATGIGTGIDASGDWDTTYSIAYRRLNDTLILFKGTGKPHIYSYCGQEYSANSNSLVPKVYFDTSDAGVDDSMSAHASAKVLLLEGYIRTLNPSTKIVERYMYDRIGTGTDLIGTWTPSGRDSILAVQGSDSDTGIQRLRDESAKWGSLEKATGALNQIQFTTDAAIIRMKRGDRAKLEAYYWERYNAAYHAITVKVISSDRLAYSATRTGEVVTLLFATDGSISYSSTNLKRTPYVEFKNPTASSQCAADRWFSTFLMENGKSTASVAGRASTATGRSAKPAYSRLP